jgi:hypothetical protein
VAGKDCKWYFTLKNADYDAAFEEKKATMFSKLYIAMTELQNYCEALKNRQSIGYNCGSW